MTPLTYIHNKTILEARRMLVYSDESINQIAWEFGFSDPAHFSSFFKRHTGMSPVEYRGQ